MTSRLQSLWIDRILANHRGVIHPGPSPDGTDALGDEPWPAGGFSHHRCELCNGPAGDRYPAHGWDGGTPGINADIFNYAICGDCLQFITNGEVPADDSITADHPDLAEECAELEEAYRNGE